MKVSILEIALLLLFDVVFMCCSGNLCLVVVCTVRYYLFIYLNYLFI